MLVTEDVVNKATMYIEYVTFINEWKIKNKIK